MTNPWDETLPEYQLNGADLVAFLDEGGGAVTRKATNFIVREGRHQSYGQALKQEYTALVYSLSFEEEEVGELLASVSYRAKISLAGRHENGKWMEIRGDGWLGYTDTSKIIGSFYAPPTILLDPSEYNDEDPAAPDDERVRAPAFMDMPDPVAPPEFIKAEYGRGISDEEY
ncbi:hypothetical protein [Sphingomicrobium flavum]|uniref:hypothetical protein n=1 Tax=Sphingomicrobium flavum TaxID=1229164 RepID=UPI0021AE2EFD|nr:hypothetical protein [Sphingomicrobium flavum]